MCNRMLTDSHLSVYFDHAPDGANIHLENDGRVADTNDNVPTILCCYYNYTKLIAGAPVSY